MFCCTVAYLLSPENAHPCHWEVVKNEAGTPICLNRNVIEFSVSNLAGTVSLIDHFTHFEIHVRTHPKKMEQMWRLAHDAVFAGMEKARKTLGYKNNIPEPAMVCPAHTATPHPATVDKDCVWTCSNESRHFGDVVEGTIPWWTVCSTQQPTVSRVSPVPPSVPSDEHPSDEQPPAHTLDINDLFDVHYELLNVAHNWRGVGRALRLHPDLLNRIGADHSDVTSRLEGVLTEWLKREYDTTRFGLPSWERLVAAVAHPAGGNDHALAEEIATRHNVPPPPPPHS
jgi:hypothetical protein